MLAAQDGCSRLPNHMDQQRSQYDQEWTPLHKYLVDTFCLTSASQVEMFIKNRADISAIDKNQSTLLHWAVSSADTEIVKVLIGNGADVNAMDENGNTAFSLVALRMDLDVVQVPPRKRG